MNVETYRHRDGSTTVSVVGPIEMMCHFHSGTHEACIRGAMSVYGPVRDAIAADPRSVRRAVDPASASVLLVWYPSIPVVVDP